jgi:hypothetical protein
MTWTHHGRRAVTVLLVVLALLAVPAIAEARFVGRQTGSLSASTARMVAPANIVGTYRCFSNSSRDALDVTVTSFVDAGPAGATYRYSLQRGTTVVTTATSTARSATISSGNLASDGGTTYWTLSVQAVLGSWTSPTTTTQTVACASPSNATGSL